MTKVPRAIRDSKIGVHESDLARFLTPEELATFQIVNSQLERALDEAANNAVQARGALNAVQVYQEIAKRIDDAYYPHKFH